jgi:cadmium resistance protein CadD (predicted permease)
VSDERAPRRLLDAFLKEAPWMLGMWGVVTLALIVFGLLSGDFSPREAITMAVGILPLAIPLAPLTWFRFTTGTREARSLRGLGASLLWAVLTMPLAIALGLYLTGLVGGE